MRAITVAANRKNWALQLAGDLSISFLASVCIALAARCAFFLPFSPIPFAIHMNVILLFAAYLGSKRATMMVSFYLLQGLAGYPVFAAGAFGIGAFLGPRGGYLMGFLLAAFIVGHLQERTKEPKGALTLFTHMGIGNLVVYLAGYIWLVQFLGGVAAFTLGVLPFILGDLIKLIFFAKLPAILTKKYTCA